MAMLKYPHIKKNAQHPKTALIQVWVCASFCVNRELAFNNSYW